MFKVKWHEFNLRRFVVFGVILGLLIIVGVLPARSEVLPQRDLRGAVGGPESIPAGSTAPGWRKMAVFAVAGALLTALAFGIGAGPWGWVVLAALVVTLLGGLAVKYGVHRFVAAYLLNAWFIIALSLPTLLSFHLPGLYRSGLIHAEPWKQALAWLVGSALWIAYTLHHVAGPAGAESEPQPVAEIPGDISPRPLTRPLILFAVIRAVAVAIAVAISYGLKLHSQHPA